MQPILNHTTEMSRLKKLTGEEIEQIRKQIEEEDRLLALETIKRSEQIKKEKIKRLFEENSLINKDLQKATLDNYTPTNQETQRALEIVKRYIEAFNLEEPRNLLFYGNYGTGKSHLSASIIKALMEKEYTSTFISMPKLHSTIKNTYNKNSERTESEIMQALEEVDLLVLDDIGAESDTDWAIQKLFEILDSRMGKHTIFTTNLNQEQLRKHLKDRNYSRIMHNTFEVKMTGQDYRLRRDKP